MQDNGQNGLTVQNNVIEAVAFGASLQNITTATGHGLTVQDNKVTLATQEVAGPTSTVGVVLSGIHGPVAASISGNDIGGAGLGYLLYAVDTTPTTTISGGSVTGVLQGVVALNLDPVSFTVPSATQFIIDGITMSGFTGNSSNPSQDFHAGVYVFTGGSNTSAVVTGTVRNVTISDTGKTAPNNAALSFSDFSTGSGVRQQITVETSSIQDNLNRGLLARGSNTDVSVTQSTVANNGFDPFGAGGNDGFGLIAFAGATISADQLVVTNPASNLAYSVYALGSDSSTLTISNSSIDNNGNVDGHLATTDTTLDASGNWWGTNDAGVLVPLLSAGVDYTPWLNSGTDTAGSTPGFQGDFSTLWVDDNSPQTGPAQPIAEAVGLVEDPGTLNVLGGTYNESVDLSTKAITLAPGASPAQLNVTGVTLNANDALVVEINGNAPGTQYDQVNVTGTVNLGGVVLNATGTITTNPGQIIVLINNDGTDPVSGTFNGLSEGDTVTINSVDFVLSYAGGSNANDVVLIEAGPVTYSSDGVGPGALELRVAGGHLQFLDDGVIVDSRPLTSLMNQTVTVNGSDPANDTLLVNYAANGFFDVDVLFNGGSGAGGNDKLIVDGGTFTDVMHNFTLTGPEHSGDIVYDTGSAMATIGYTGLEPVDMTGSTITDLVFNLPAGSANDFNLQDDGNLTNGLSRIVSNGGFFETTDFVNPTGSLTINAGAMGDYYHAFRLDDGFAAPITFNGSFGADRMYVHTAATNIIPVGGISFVGNGNNDGFAIFSGYAATNVDYTFTNQNDGSINIDGRTISFDNMNVAVGVFDLLTATHRSFQFPSTSDVITFGDDAPANDNVDRLQSTSSSVVVDFISPTSSLTLNGGDGNDSINIGSNAGVDTKFNASLTIDGQGDTDALHFIAANGLNTAGTLTVTAETIDQTTSLTIGGLSTFTTTNALTLTNAANDFSTVTASSANPISLFDENSLTVTAITGTDISITANDALTVDGAINAGSATVNLIANMNGAGADDFTMTSNGSINTTNDSANAVSISVNTLLGGTGNATLNTITAGTTAGAAGGRVTVSAAMGAILDGNAAALNITAGNAVLSGVGGVGTLVDPLETQVAQLEGSGGAGGFFVTNTGSLTIGGISGGVNGISTSSGQIQVITAGSLTVAENVIGGGLVALQATETAGSGEDLTVQTGATVRSTANNVDLKAGDNLTLAAGSLVEAPAGSVALKGDSGNADALGSAITIAGVINSLTGATATGDSDNDTIVVSALGSGGLLLDGLGGDDDYIITYPDLPATFGSSMTVNDSVAGNDQVTVNGTNAADELFLTTENPPTTATTEEVSRGAVGNEAIVLHDNIEGLSIFLLDEIDVMHAQPSMLFPVSLDGGEPCFGDPGVPPGDQLDFNPLGNTFSISGNVILTDGGVPDPFFGVDFIDFESLPLSPLGAPPGGALLFDFNHTNTAGTMSNSPTQVGYVGVQPNLLYSDGLGYGWQHAVMSFERDDGFYGNTYTDLYRDGHSLNASETFTADLPNGWYLVSAMLGSPYTSVTGVSIKNADSGGTLASGITTEPEESKHVSFAVEVKDGTLDLQFNPSANNPKIFAVNGLSIRPAILLSMGLDCPTGALTADGVTVDSFTLYEAPANSLITVTTSLGTIMNVDVDDELQGIQVLTDAQGQATILLRRPTGEGQAIVQFEEVTGAKTGLSGIDYVLPNSRHFDFNHINTTSSTTQSPTQPPVASAGFPDGYLGVPQSQIYNAATGYGWITSPRGFDLGGLTDSQGQPVVDPDPFAALRRDGAMDNVTRTFRVDLPDGAYTYVATIGFDQDIDGMRIDANGSQINNISVLAGERLQVTGTVTVNGGVALFTFSDLGGNAPNWVINGLDIRPAVTVQPIVFAPNIGGTPSDGLTITPITAATSLPDGSQVTVSTTLGTIVTPDVNSTIDGVQVLASSGAIAFDVLAPTTPGTPTFTATSLDGLHQGSISSPAFLTFAPAAGRRFDFNHTRTASGTGQSPTAVGFVGVLRTDTNRAVNAYGWDIAPNSYDVGVPNGDDQGGSNTYSKLTTDLYRDYHSGHIALGARTFSVLAAPMTVYDLRVYLGSQDFDSSNKVTVEGVVGSQTLDLAAKQFNSLTFAGATDVDADGYIEITFTSGNTISPLWAANGLDVVTTGSGLPLSAPLMAAERGTGAVGETLTRDELEPLVAYAINAWQAQGLSQPQLAVLQATQFSIRDLGANGALGIVDGNGRVIIDDNGAGIGWSLQTGQPASDRYDLLTVIAHELGHRLGLEDLAESVVDELMSAFLQVGDRQNTLHGIDGFFSSFSG